MLSRFSQFTGFLPNFLFSVIISFLFVQQVSADHIANINSNPNDALPFSLSISGGVSLGSYEAGVNWALIHYLKIQREKYEAAKKQQRSLYPDLASVSGASAGSINALFSAISWCVDEKKAIEYAQKNPGSYPFKDSLEKNLFRDIWVNVGIEELLPDPTVNGKYAADDGLFTRHAFDYAINNLKSTLSQPIFREDCLVRIGITVTRVKPSVMSVAGVKVKNQRFMIPLRIETDKINKGKAVIVSHVVNKNDPDMGNVMYLQGKQHPASKNKYIIHSDDVVESILTSSAFPIAFGRKKLRYCSRELTTNTTNKASKCPDGYLARTDEFLDGGVFDNVPLGIAKALAEPKPTDQDKKSTWKKSARRYNYVYIDPGNLRDTSNEKNADMLDKEKTAANDEMTFGLQKQLKFLTGAINTGRNYELYNILRGGEWTRQSYAFACQLYSIINNIPAENCINSKKISFSKCKSLYYKIDNRKKLSSKNKKILSTCLLNNAIYLEREYTVKIKNSKVQYFGCNYNGSYKYYGEKILGARNCLLTRLAKLATKLNRPELVYAIKEATNDDLGDRRILLTTRFAPITGNMLAYFGAFLDKAFREYDYYAGIYDAINVIASYHCERTRQKRCLSKLTKSLYQNFNIGHSAAANTVFTLLAKHEHLNNTKNDGMWKWIENIEPTKIKNEKEKILVKNLEIIFKSLTLTVKQKNITNFTMFEEFIFFSKNLLSNNYNTATSDSSKFMKRLNELKDEDTSNWFYPITSRIGGRLIQLENTEVEKNHVPGYIRQLLGVAALAVHSYIKNGDNSLLRHSSAPVNVWQQYLPYEVGVDARNGGLHLAWEPSISLSKSFSFNVNLAPVTVNRFSGEEIFFSQASLFLNYQRDSLISSIGIGPTINKTWKKWPNSKQTNVGGSIYFGLLRDKIRLTLGTRSFNKRDFYGDTIFVDLSITDIPGFSYWLFH